MHTCTHTYIHACADSVIFNKSLGFTNGGILLTGDFVEISCNKGTCICVENHDKGVGICVENRDKGICICVENHDKGVGICVENRDACMQLMTDASSCSLMHQ
jgi:hypothetical protein